MSNLDDSYTNVSYPNGTQFLTFDRNKSINISNTTLTDLGSYQVKVFVNDTFNNSNITTTNFSVIASNITVDLVAPSNGTIFSSGAVQFVYNVTGTEAISTCTLIYGQNGLLNNRDTLSSIQKWANQTFNKTFESGYYNWSINCTDDRGTGNWTATYANWTFLVSIPTGQSGTTSTTGTGQNMADEIAAITEKIEKNVSIRKAKTGTLWEKLFPRYSENIKDNKICELGEDPLFVDYTDCKVSLATFFTNETYKEGWVSRYLFVAIIGVWIYPRIFKRRKQDG